MLRTMKQTPILLPTERTAMRITMNPQATSIDRAQCAATAAATSGTLRPGECVFSRIIDRGTRPPEKPAAVGPRSARGSSDNLRGYEVMSPAM